MGKIKEYKFTKLKSGLEVKKHHSYYLVTQQISDFNLIREHGRSRAERECQICGAAFVYYIFSMSACGKNCPSCGVYHGVRKIRLDFEKLTEDQKKQLEREVQK